jgi:hypothetical protein
MLHKADAALRALEASGPSRQQCSLTAMKR